jgi:hypothetical protein
VVERRFMTSHQSRAAVTPAVPTSAGDPTVVAQP